MTPDVDTNKRNYQPDQPPKRRIFGLPGTRLGWWAVALAGLFILLFLINSFVFMPTASDAAWRRVVLPFYGIFMMLCGLTAGFLGMIAIIRQQERSILVLLTLLPEFFVLFFLLGEFLAPY